ncbi:MAG: glycosyltransferase family 4 protein, partial [Nitrosopumilus sp.]
MSKRILLISEALSVPFDEGIKNVVFSLHRQLEMKRDVLSVTKAKNDTGDLKILKIGLNKLFLNNKLRKLIKSYSPAVILYLPEASITFNSFVRAKVLKFMNKLSKVVMLGVKRVEYLSIQKSIIANFLKPDLLLLLEKSNGNFFRGKGLKVKVLPPAVDNAKFCPATEEEKQKMRAEYSIPNNKKVVLHVGHIRTTRNVECLLELQKIDNIQVVIVGSTSTCVEKKLKNCLMIEGAKVIDEFIQDIAKIYKMSDIYVFPVFNKIAAIDMPLSVLEALACNLPVITTRFGGLVDYFKEDTGFRYYNTTEDLVELVKHMDKDVDKSEIHNNRKVER